MESVTYPRGWFDPPDDEPCPVCHQIDCVCETCELCGRLVEDCPNDHEVPE